jgi:hypothetical protein
MQHRRSAAEADPCEGLAPAKAPLGRALFTSWRMVETAETIAT